MNRRPVPPAQENPQITTGLLNPTHIAILLIVVLLVLGPTKLRDTGRSLGRAMREFKDGITGRDNTPAETDPTPTTRRGPPPPRLSRGATGANDRR